MKLDKVKDIVKELLTKYPALRDSDNRLMLNVWAYQDKYLLDKEKRFSDFAEKFGDEFYFTPESITRCRRKHQEDNPELRGANYKKRQAEQENIKKQLKAF